MGNQTHFTLFYKEVYLFIIMHFFFTKSSKQVWESIQIIFSSTIPSNCYQCVSVMYHCMYLYEGSNTYQVSS